MNAVKYLQIAGAAAITCGGFLGFGISSPAHAENLFKPDDWNAMASDRRARNVGDIVTIIIYENSSTSNVAQSGTRKNQTLNGSLSGGSISETGGLSFGGGYTGQAEERRSGQIVAQLSVTVSEVLPNGDFIIVGKQKIEMDKGSTTIGIKGRIREADLMGDNRILSSRIADAQINYDGKGFVARGAKPGIISQIFSFLGLT